MNKPVVIVFTRGLIWMPVCASPSRVHRHRMSISCLREQPKFPLCALVAESD